uniref:Phospholipase-like protein n=1 Tax=Tanacetum cinerariifolium TaxID=118510 RepID=A0A6L2KCB1_TANCI|nr:phospholipase-like protein [Tanacetum cinerariifolium]
MSKSVLGLVLSCFQKLKRFLSVKLNRERLFGDTVFVQWLGIPLDDNDSHMMHYVLQHQLVDDFDAWNAFLWGEYMWDKFYRKTVNVVSKHTNDHLVELSNPNVALISSPEEMRRAWFMASVYYIKGLADQDGNLFQDDEARVNCTEHNNGMCGDTEVGKFVQDKEARVNGIDHHNRMYGDTEVGKFVQDEEARVNEDSNFVEGIDETICPKSNQMSDEEGDGVLDSEGDDVHLSQTNDVIQQALSSSSSNPRNDKDASPLDNLMKIDGKPTLDVVVPPKDDDCILRTWVRKANEAYDVVEVDNYENDYMLLLNDKEKLVKSS